MAMSIVDPPAYLWSMVAYNSLLLIGIPGNLIIIKVYHVKSPRTSAHIFIVGLALADLIVTMTRPLYIFTNIPMYAHLKHGSELLCRLPRLLGVISIYSSVFLTSAVAIDRYYCVCKPHERKMTPIRAKFMVASCFALSMLVSIPSIFSFGLLQLPYGLGTVCTRISKDLLTLFQQIILIGSVFVSCGLVAILYHKVFKTIKTQRLRMNRSLHSSLTPSATTETMSAGPSSVLPPENPKEAFVETVVAPVSSERTQHHGIALPSMIRNRTLTKKDTNKSSSQSAERRTSQMLLLTTTVFIVTWVPPLIITYFLQRSLSQNPAGNSSIILVIKGLTNIVAINHAINPLIYGFVNKRFREDCKKVVKGIKWPCKKV